MGSGRRSISTEEKKKRDPAKAVAKKRSNILKISISYAYAGLLQLAVLVLLLLIIVAFKPGKKPATLLEADASTEEKLFMISGSSAKWVHALRFSEIEKESKALLPMQEDIQSLIQSQVAAGLVTDVSVYFSLLDEGNWISIQAEDKFRPGSINKLPLMIYFLKMEELNAGTLNHQIAYSRPIANPKNETYRESLLLPGQSYTVRDLLEHMIVHSDNIATTLLLMNIRQPDLYVRVFEDLGLPAPAPHDPDYSLTARDCSRFLQVLYNATYLNEALSHHALDLLTRATFREGLAGAVPEDILVAHKFGEAGAADHPQFSETGIFYAPGNTYLLTVMTQGHDPRQQAALIREISGLVWNYVTR